MAKHYYIAYGDGSFPEIFPSNEPEATKRQIEGTRVWREEVDELRLPKTTNSIVYDLLHSYFIDKTKFDDEVAVEIYTGTRDTGTLYWQGLFSISDTKDDFEKTVAILNPLRTNDNYRTILEQASRRIELDADGRTILETKRVGYSESVSLTAGWVNPANGYTSAWGTFTANAGNITSAIATGVTTREGASNALSALTKDDIFIIDVSAYTRNSGADPQFDIQYGASNTSMASESPKAIATGLLAFTISTGQASPRLVLQTQTTPFGTCDISATFTVRKIQAANDKTLAGELLMTFLNGFISSSTYMGVAAFNGNVVSTFIDNDALPTGAPSSISTFIGANPNGNYVTETSDNELNDTIIGLLREWFDTANVSFKLSLNDIMAQLRDVLQVYWFIDADGKFRVEHEKYFVKQVDDSTPIVLDAQDEVDAREMVYNKAVIASTETFQWAQSQNRDFVGNDIIYNNFETTSTSNEISANYFTTDIKYVIDNIDDASNSGFGLYQCNLIGGIDGDDVYEINIATGDLSSAAIANAEFSWANLHNKYWRWSRMSESATINSVASSMESSIRFLEQANVRFFHATAIDPYTMITATLTGGAPIAITRSLETDFNTIIIGYDPYKL